MNFIKPTKLCPLCGETLVLQSPEDAQQDIQDLYCQRSVIFPLSGKRFSHYREGGGSDFITMYVPPYRIINTQGESRVGIHSRYKTGEKKHYFKTIVVCPTIPPTLEENMANRIKMVLVFS